jgi:hypothetical protein
VTVHEREGVPATPTASTPTSTEPHRRAEFGDPIADPGLPEHQPRPTDVDERAERGPSARSRPCSACPALCTLLFCVSYFVFKVGDNPTSSWASAPRTWPSGLTSGWPCCCIGRRHHPVGAQAHERPRDRRDAAPDRVQRDRPRGDHRSPQPGIERLRRSAAARWSATRCSAPGAARPARGPRAARPRPAAGVRSSTTPSGAEACASSTTSRGRRSSPMRSRSAS